ncbi:MAG: hypothetical protein KAQ94_03815 [Arcobacteraceae bacterium]|nr:hypothetical protein [Arcobacteraceae bacterium]
MRVFIGYGNDLRGEDAFGIDVIKELEKYELEETKFISIFQLTPEIVLELLDYDEIIFIDACYSLDNQYSLACSIKKQNSSSLTHHIFPENIIAILNGVYGKYPKYQIISMLTNKFDKIYDHKQYHKVIYRAIDYIVELYKYKSKNSLQYNILVKKRSYND